MDIEKIRSRMRDGKYSISFTHTEKLRERMIEAADVEEAVSSGGIIEPYSDDPRGASCLILGFARSGKPLGAFPVCPHAPFHVPPPLAPPTRGGEALGMARVSSPLMGEDGWGWSSGFCKAIFETWH